MNSLEQAEDLKAFERRLTEYVSCLQPATGRWRMILIVVSVCTATGAWNWLIDPDTQKVSFFSSLWNHPFFTISCITLIALFFAGIHKRVVAPSMYPYKPSPFVCFSLGWLSHSSLTLFIHSIAARCRTVLAEYNMSCDDTGKLILKPRPNIQ
ncbi:nuclear envelope phosphatase-regulatory subunit 1 isoform X1 [Syngnathus acus]|uniref:nuclear envelope phosphatase-regulatory subunit 1 isoform X1 n=1 Tax=Syngnathus acus TaxID=161584 RepID=UPI001885E78A|nr:nuclear envelope phosphatase-regulatory subunit 1 isoform X1 [Syngnathus acus]